MRSVYDAIKAVIGIAPIAQGASAATSAAIDTLGYNSALVEVVTGAATGTPDSYTIPCKVQECATSGGSYTDVTGATATLAADGKHAQIRVEGLGTSRQRYLKVVMTPAITGGSSPKVLIAASVLLGNGYNKPADNSATAAQSIGYYALT